MNRLVSFAVPNTNERIYMHSSWSLSSTKIALLVLNYRTLLYILLIVRDRYSTEFRFLGSTKSIEGFVFFSVQKFENRISHIWKTDQYVRRKLQEL